MVNNAEIPLPSTFPEQAAKSPSSKHWEDLLVGKGYTRQNSPWFLVEQYIFHLVILMTDYYTTHFDPFHNSKVAELKGDTPWSLLQTALGISTQVGSSPQSRHGQLKRFMLLSLWGNKADGTNEKVKSTMHVAGDSLVFDDNLVLVDHSDQVISFLEKKSRESGGARNLGVEYISDNIGTELLLDLAMADHMLANNWCGKVTFDVKVEPIYVSDVMPLCAATGPDVESSDYYGPGNYFEIWGPPKRVQAKATAHDKDAAQNLWKESERLAKLKFDVKA